MYAFRRAMLASTIAVVIAGIGGTAGAREAEAPPAEGSTLYAPADNDGPVALSPADRLSYTTAFDALRRGDLEAARASARRANDRVLLGQVEFERLFHPDYSATYEELAAWLEDYADLPMAERAYNLALRRRTDGAAEPRRPGGLASRTWGSVAAAARGTEADPAKAARVAYNNDDLSTAYGLGVQIGDWWTAGLAAWRLGQHADALAAFDRVAVDPTEDPWVRAGAGVWAARAAGASGRRDRVTDYLKLSARWPATFYGQVALRQLGEDVTLEGQGPRPYAPALQRAAVSPEFVRVSNTDLNAFIRTDDRARRAVALMEVGRRTEAEDELKAGLRTAPGDAAHRMWLGLVAAVAPLMGRTGEDATRVDVSRYPTPALAPDGGYTVEPALVYAVARKETDFNAQARSGAGAYGMMQVMPTTAAEMTGDRDLTRKPERLFEPSLNLRLGQTYLNRMFARPEFQGDLLRAVASYNAGPGPMLAALRRLGPDPDPLLLIETIDVPQAREYVEKVVAAYWIYQRMFGGKLNTLDAVAAGQSNVSIMLDYTPPPPAPVQAVDMASAPATPGGL
jgi:soluble lytic murein transglycosylase-like protein